MSRAPVRQMVIDRSGGWCEWPSHNHPGAELAHFHSIGMGGNPLHDRDAWNNVGWFCRDTARISDGEHGSGGAAQYRLCLIQLFGSGVFDSMHVAARGWNRAEALRKHIESRYPQKETL